MTARSCANCVEETPDWRWASVNGKKVRLCIRCNDSYTKTRSLPGFYHPVEKGLGKSTKLPTLDETEKKIR